MVCAAKHAFERLAPATGAPAPTPASPAAPTAPAPTANAAPPPAAAASGPIDPRTSEPCAILDADAAARIVGSPVISTIPRKEGFFLTSIPKRPLRRRWASERPKSPFSPCGRRGLGDEGQKRAGMQKTAVELPPGVGWLILSPVGSDCFAFHHQVPCRAPSVRLDGAFAQQGRML